MKRVLVALTALSVCALMRAQSSPATHDLATSASAKASPSADGKPALASKPDVAGRIELRDTKPQSSPAASPLVLKDTSPVSTEDVVRGVAEKLAKQEGGESNGQTASTSSNKAKGGTGSTSKASSQARSPQEPTQASDAVMEFQPAPPGSGTPSSAAVVLDGAQNKSSRVHGDLYGVTGAEGHATGGSVGATSKSGKTSVYLQSDEARSKAGQPQQ